MKNKTIGQRLEVLLREYPEFTTREKVASHLGCTRNTVECILNEKSNASPKIITAIVEKLGTTYEWIQEGKGEMLPNGKKDVSTASGKITADPWRDALIEELKAEANKWYQEYLDQKNMLKMALTSLGKLSPDGKAGLLRKTA